MLKVVALIVALFPATGSANDCEDAKEHIRLDSFGEAVRYDPTSEAKQLEMEALDQEIRKFVSVKRTDAQESEVLRMLTGRVPSNRGLDTPKASEIQSHLNRAITFGLDVRAIIKELESGSVGPEIISYREHLQRILDEMERAYQ